MNRRRLRHRHKHHHHHRRNGLNFNWLRRLNGLQIGLLILAIEILYGIYHFGNPTDPFNFLVIFMWMQFNWWTYIAIVVIVIGYWMRRY